MANALSTTNYMNRVPAPGPTRKQQGKSYAVAEGFTNTNTQGADDDIRAKRRKRLRIKLRKQGKTPTEIENAIKAAGLQ